jgi:hypothetical protein
MPEVTKHNFMTDGDWLRELRTAKDEESLNKVKKTYSQIFGDPLVKKEEKDYDRSEETEEKIAEKQKKAEEFDKFFKEEEKQAEKEEKSKSHIVGNIIMILLILLILFEGSVLAAKLIAPESGYAHISDRIVEKVVDLVRGGDDASSEESADTDAVPVDNTSVEAGTYMAMISELSKSANTIGEVVYNEGLNYSMVPQSNFEGVEKMETLQDSQWTDTRTYAGGIFEVVINYYNEWKDRNTDETLVGIDSLELGEIKQGNDGYYILTKNTYATSDGNKAATYQTCYVSILEGNMFINEIKGETVNG